MSDGDMSMRIFIELLTITIQCMKISILYHVCMPTTVDSAGNSAGNSAGDSAG